MQALRARSLACQGRCNKMCHTQAHVRASWPEAAMVRRLCSPVLARRQRADPRTIQKMAVGAITTLGRGGSDLTATFFGAALCLREVVVWKDVDGVLSSDPRLVRDARVIDRLTYDEATELAYFGAQVRCYGPSPHWHAQACTENMLGPLFCFGVVHIGAAPIDIEHCGAACVCAP